MCAAASAASPVGSSTLPDTSATTLIARFACAANASSAAASAALRRSINAAITFGEPLPVALVVALISAGVLARGIRPRRMHSP